MAVNTKGLTPEKVEVYRAVAYILLQIIIVFVLLGLLIWTLFELFQAKSEDKWKYVLVDGFFSYTLYKIIAFFFPTPASKKAPVKRKSTVPS